MVGVSINHILPTLLLLPLSLSAPSTHQVLVPAGTLNYGDLRKESPVKSQSPDESFSSVSVVSLFEPLPKEFDNITPACDYISYLRFKHNDGPSNSSEADRILSFMPGTLAGASSMDKMARNVIFESKKLGLNVEVWSLDRRSHFRSRERDYQDTLDYYYHGKTIDGQKFDGFYSNGDKKLKFLSEIGVDQTSKDWHAIINRELPDGDYRATKHYASGHSLGGPLTAYFANYLGEDGTRGYNNAAGYLSYDAVVRPIGVDEGDTSVNPFKYLLAPLRSLGFAAFKAGLKSGLLPRSLFTVIPIILTPEVGQFTSIIGMLSVLDGKALMPFEDIPQSLGLSSVNQAIFSKTVLNFLTFTPNYNNFKITRDAFMGCFFGDRIQPIGPLQVSIGFPVGGKIGEKVFPFGRYDDALGAKNLSDAVPLLKALDTAPYPMAAPTEADGLFGEGPLYSLLNYDEIKDDGSNVAKTPSGYPFVNSSNQVTEKSDFARALAEFPLDYTEHYYPIRVTMDGMFDSKGVKEAIKTNVYKDGYQKRPRLALVGSEGLALNQDLGENHFIAPGYNHLDTISASRKQNLGREEIISIQTAKFISQLGSGIIFSIN